MLLPIFILAAGLSCILLIMALSSKPDTGCSQKLSNMRVEIYRDEIILFDEKEMQITHLI